MTHPIVTSIAVITTDKCTASCSECCFQCTPKNKNKLTFEKIKMFIDDLPQVAPKAEIIVFTGGEATLLGKDLFMSIEYATAKGYMTRIVTNAWWAHSLKSAERMIGKLIEAGLTEINISTGDNHQEWVSVDNVVNACTTCINNNLRILVSVEAFDGAKFSANDLLEKPEIQELKKIDYDQKLIVISSPWISIHGEKNFSHDTLQNREETGACESIFTHLGLNEVGEITSCCGLTQTEIPELNLSKQFPELSTEEALSQQGLDILKVWIWLDGPEKIYNLVTSHNKEITSHKTMIHICEYCSELFQMKKFRVQ